MRPQQPRHSPLTRLRPTLHSKLRRTPPMERQRVCATLSGHRLHWTCLRAAGSPKGPTHTWCMQEHTIPARLRPLALLRLHRRQQRQQIAARPLLVPRHRRTGSTLRSRCHRPPATSRRRRRRAAGSGPTRATPRSRCRVCLSGVLPTCAQCCMALLQDHIRASPEHGYCLL